MLIQRLGKLELAEILHSLISMMHVVRTRVIERPFNLRSQRSGYVVELNRAMLLVVKIESGGESKRKPIIVD